MVYSNSAIASCNPPTVKTFPETLTKACGFKPCGIVNFDESGNDGVTCFDGIGIGEDRAETEGEDCAETEGEDRAETEGEDRAETEGEDRAETEGDDNGVCEA